MSVAIRRGRPVRRTPAKRNGRALSETNERLQLMQQVTAAVYGTLDSEEVFKRITDGAVFSLGYTVAFVAALNSEKQCFEIKALSAKKEVLPQMEKLLGLPLTRLSVPANAELAELNAVIRSLAEGKVVVVKTLAEIAYPLFSKEVCSALQKLARSKNYIVVPLQTGDRVGGAVYVSSPRDEVPEEELLMLQNFAAVASQAIRNAHLYTKTRQAQEALQSSVIRYEELADSITDLFFAFDKELRYTYWNKASEELTGILAKDAFGKHLYEISPRDEQTEKAERVYLEVLKDKQPKHFVNEYQFGDKHFFFEISAYPTRGGLSVFARDITERKRAEEMLRESEEKYRTIFENVNDTVIRLNRYGEVVDINSRAEDYFGYKREEIVGKNFAELGVLSPEDLAKMGKLFEEIVESKPTPLLIEVEAKRKDGSTALLEVNTAVVNKDGEIEGTVAILRDITERKQAELEYKTIIQTTMDGFWLVDMQGRFLDVNDAYCQLIGYSRVELLKMSIPDIEAIEKSEETAARIARIRKVGRDRFETQHRCKDGRIVDVEVSINYIDVGGGRFFVFVRDITERKQAKKALEESEEKYATLVEKSHDGIIIVQDGVLKFANSRMIEMTGFSRDEALGKPFTEFIPPEHLNMLLDRYARRAAGDKVPDNYETEIQTRDGKRIPVEVTVSRFEYRGNFVEMVMLRDITERKQAQEALRESRRRFRDMVNLLPQSVWEIDTEGHVTFLNRYGIQSYGYGLDEVKGPFDGTVAYVPEDRERMRENVRRILNGEKLGGIEYTAVRKDGSPFPVIIYAAPIMQGNKAVGLRGVTIDITERKQAEEALKESEKKYATLVEQSTDGILIIRDGLVEFANSRLLEMASYSLDEVVGKPFLEFVAPEYTDMVLDRYTRRLAGEEVANNYEIAILAKDGRKIPVEIDASRIEYRGGLADMVIIRDISERKQAEELYGLVANSSPVGIYIAVDNEYVFVNKTLQRSTGYTEKELLSIDPTSTIHPEDMETARAKAVQMLKGESFEPYQYRFITKTGEIRWAIGRVASITYGGRRATLGVAIDITESKQAEHLYYTLADSAPVGIYIIQDHKYVFTNPTLQKLTGYTANELLATPPAAFLHPEDVESTGQKQVQMLKGQTFQPIEHRFITKNGEIGWSLERVTSVTYQGRRAVLGVAIDITESKRAEQLYYTLANSSPVGVYIVQDNKFVFTNPAFQRATGYAEDELMARDPSTIVYPEDRESVRQNAVQMLRVERLQPYEFRFVTKSGETRWALERVTSIIYQGRRATLANFMDITGRKEVQERIQRAAEEWRTTFDSITDFISIHDKDNRIVRVNKALANALKTTPQALVGKVCHGMVHGTEEPPANCPHRQTIMTGKPATIEMFEPTLGIHFQESTSPIFNERGEVTGSVHVVRDMSERKRMEEQLVMTDRLASIGELASGIAHELNNPLTSVIGFSQLLMEGDIPANIKEDLGTVYSEAQRAAAIVKNLLTFARKHAPVKQLSQVNSILEDVLRLRAYEHKVNNIEVDKQLATNLPEIMVDYFQMQQVFLNLIVNAEFAMLEAHGKGKLTITTERTNGVIKVAFTDDGPGIAKENMKRIFSPFFTTKEVGKGTGLGLSICHGIVSEHGGRIYAESEFGHGATFVVELPSGGH